MGWPKNLILVRHAESEGNVLSTDERAQYDRSTDKYKLTERGREQAKITGSYLQKRFGSFDIYYVSYYARSIETMAIMFPDAKVYQDPRLAEANRGIWHTMTEKEIEVHYPGEIKRRQREGNYHYRPLGGENWPDIELRIHSFLGTLNRDYDGQNVIMVVHGNWLVLFQRLVHHYQIHWALDRYKNKPFENASVTVYQGKMVQGKNRLVLKEKNLVPWRL